MTTQAFQSIDHRQPLVARGGSRSPVAQVQERLLAAAGHPPDVDYRAANEITAAPERTTEYRMAVLAKRGQVVPGRAATRPGNASVALVADPGGCPAHYRHGLR